MSVDLAKLNKFEPVFKESPTETEVPNGTYAVRVVKISTGMTQNDNPNFIWHLKILEGPEKGRMIFKNKIFASHPSVEQFKKDLFMCGFEVESLKEAFQSKDDLLGTRLEVTKTSREQFTIVYFQKYLEQDEVPA